MLDYLAMLFIPLADISRCIDTLFTHLLLDRLPLHTDPGTLRAFMELSGIH